MRFRYCSRLFRDGNVSELSLFALRDRGKEEEKDEKWADKKWFQ